MKEFDPVRELLFDYITVVAECTLAVRLVMGEALPKAGYAAILISTAFFDVLSYLIKWYLEKEEADKINQKIEEHRKRKAIKNE